MSDNNWQQQVWQQPQPPQGVSTPQGSPAPQQPYASAPYYPQPPKKSRGWIVALVSIVLIFALLAIGMFSCSSMMSSSFGSLGSLGSLGSIDDTSEVDYLTSDAIGIISIDGTIQYDGTTASPEGLKSQLDKAAKNSHVKALVLRVNSGGGVATAGEEMSEYVREFSESTGKPVVVSSASLNASAAYEISSQSDYIYTAKTTAIGSIGVAMQVTDLSGLYEKLGISMDTITSSDSKDSSYGNRPLTEEERAYYQDQVTQINETFIQTVAEGRGLSVEEVRPLATGLTFTGMDAVENGLADEIGTLDNAVAKAAELANVSAYKTVSLKVNSSSFTDLLGLLSSSRLSPDDPTQAIKELQADDIIAR